MSPENVEIVRRMYDGWVHGDFRVEREVFDPRIEFSVRWLPGRSTVNGHEAMREEWRDFLSQWHDWRTGPIDDLIDRGDRIAVFNQVIGRTKRGQLEIRQNGAALFTFLGGKIVRLVLTDTTDPEVAGLRE